MPLDFPNSPAINDAWTGSNGVTYTWTGTMWTVSGSGAGPYLPLAGGTMTGALALAADPTTSPQAATKRYTDNAINLAGNYLGTWSVAANSPNISAGGSISNANYVAVTVNPATPEVVPAGVPGIAGLTVANGDRVIWASGLGTWQILRNAGVTLAAADARYVALGGSTMTGALTLPGNAASALQAVPLQQVPAASSTTPAMDGTATVGAGTTWARADHIHPTDTSRASVAAMTAAGAAAANNVGRNLIHNPLFNVAQRGAGPFTASGNYTADRWQLSFGNGSSSVTVAAIVDASRAQIGDEAASWALANAFVGSATAGSYNMIWQQIEDVHRLAGKTVTVSFYAAALSGAPKLGVSFDQNFGSGGSPSATVNGNGASVTLGTAWARYSVPLTLASIAGKTLGSNGDSKTTLNLWHSAEAAFAARSGSIGVQSGTVFVWGVQLEIGSVATPLEKPDPQVDLAKCQRFFCTMQCVTQGYGLATGGVSQTLTLPVPMRGVPTLTPTTNANTNIGTLTLTALNQQAVWPNSTVTASGTWTINQSFTASADL